MLRRTAVRDGCMPPRRLRPEGSARADCTVHPSSGELSRIGNRNPPHADGTSSTARSSLYPSERLSVERPHTSQLARCKRVRSTRLCWEVPIGTWDASHPLAQDQGMTGPSPVRLRCCCPCRRIADLGCRAGETERRGRLQESQFRGQIKQQPFVNKMKYFPLINGLFFLLIQPR